MKYLFQINPYGYIDEQRIPKETTEEAALINKEFLRRLRKKLQCFRRPLPRPSPSTPASVQRPPPDFNEVQREGRLRVLLNRFRALHG